MTTVYFIKPIGMDGPIKIGCSQSPEYRRSALETWSPFPLEIIGEISGDFNLERRFHAKFLASHQHREWFGVTDELLSVIEAVNAGTFDPASLPDPIRLPQNHGNRKRQRTPEERLRQSYALRIAHATKRTGYGFYGYCGPEWWEAAPRYLEAPHLVGTPIDALWAKERQRTWLASIQS